MGGHGYYRPEAALAERPDSGDAVLGKGQCLAVETMLQTMRSSHAFDPLGVYVPWARQKGGLSWEPIAAPDHELILYPVTDRTIARVNAASYGAEVPWIAVVTEKPVTARLADEVWDATRYDHFATEAVYDAADTRQAPRICFLYWAQLHDDVGGGHGSLDAVAARLGGRLVFPMHLPVDPGLRPPALPFRLVLEAQLAGPAAAAGLGAEAPPPSPPQKSMLGPALLMGAAVAAGYVFWGAIRPAPRRNGRRRR